MTKQRRRTKTNTNYESAPIIVDRNGAVGESDSHRRLERVTGTVLISEYASRIQVDTRFGRNKDTARVKTLPSTAARGVHELDIYANVHHSRHRDVPIDLGDGEIRARIGDTRARRHERQNHHRRHGVHK